MANSTVNLITDAIGGAGIAFDLPVDGGTHIYKGVLVTQLTGTRMLVPYSTASAGVCLGVSQHEADNTSGSDGAIRCVVESRRMYAFTNGAGGDAFSEATNMIGSLVYATDDHTVSDNSATQTLKPVGFFYGMEADGKVRVLIDPHTAKIVETLQLLTDAPATADALRENIIAAFG